ncbi:MAG: hypothetical protein ACLP3K_11570 [Candidatus Acidiferrales bacterium]
MDYRRAVELGGGIFDCVRADVVYFRASSESALLSLYAIACNPENVRLSLKADRERGRDLYAWEKAGEVPTSA